MKPVDMSPMVNRRKLLALTGTGAVVGPFGLAGCASAGIANPFSKKGGTSASAFEGNEGLPWPQRGHFGCKAIVGPHQASAEAMIDDRTFFGLPRERTFFYGCVRDADGNLYEIVRGIAGKGYGGLDTLFVQSSEDKDTLHVIPEIGMAAAPSAGHIAELDGGNAVWRSAPGAEGKAFRITMNADGSKATWFEEDVMDLEGELLGPGLQWHVPDVNGSEFYVSQVYELRGTLFGKPVRGVAGLDQSYLPQGVLMYSGQDPLFRKDTHHRCWYTWGTRYKDGSYESGHFVLGTDRIGFGIVASDTGELTLSTNVSGNVALKENDIWPERIVLDVDGVEWEFLPDPKGRMPDLLHGAIQSWTPQNEGRWRRVGDKREPEVWFAWGEVQPAAKLGYTRSTRF